MTAKQDKVLEEAATRALPDSGALPPSPGKPDASANSRKSTFTCSKAANAGRHHRLGARTQGCEMQLSQKVLQQPYKEGLT